MKAFLIFITFFFLSVLNAEDTTDQTEKDYDSPIVRNGSVVNSGGLTDQEKQLSEEYHNSSRYNRIVKEQCDTLKTDACHEDANNALIESVAKAYSAFNLASAPDITNSKFSFGKESEKSTQIATDAKTDPNSTDDTKSMKDYCVYIPVGFEAFAFAQDMAQEKTQLYEYENAKTNKQRESLVQIKKEHENRAKTAEFQTIGWGATTACYPIMIAYNSGLTNWKPDAMTMLRFAGAGLLTWFYNEQASDHKNYAKDVGDVLEHMDSLGNCNPVTQKKCYCNDPSTMNDPKYCSDEIKARIAAKYDSTFNKCTNSQLDQDPDCECLKNNSCIDEVVMKRITVDPSNIHLQNFPQDVVKDGLTGKIKDADLNKNAANTKAMADKALEELKKNDIDPIGRDLNAQELKQFDLLKKLGVPDGIASNIAGRPLDDKAKEFIANTKGLSNMPDLPKFNPQEDSRTLSYTSGSGLNKKKKKSSDQLDFLKQFQGKNKNQGSGTRVSDYANQAHDNAAISNKRTKSIFKIISYRYQMSGLKALERP
ncbi:MAG: hypothetical protein H6622_10710 [Halobacteriovoraceae bacterium]|nr:hypothetical protein [Halobacteriovoraceae bacterium]